MTRVASPTRTVEMMCLSPPDASCAFHVFGKRPDGALEGQWQSALLRGVRIISNLALSFVFHYHREKT